MLVVCCAPPVILLPGVASRLIPSAEFLDAPATVKDLGHNMIHYKHTVWINESRLKPGGFDDEHRKPALQQAEALA